MAHPPQTLTNTWNPHRVLIPKEEILRRLPSGSIVFVLNPDNGVIVNPFNGSQKYPPIMTKDYLLKRHGDTYKY